MVPLIVAMVINLTLFFLIVKTLIHASRMRNKRGSSLAQDENHHWRELRAVFSVSVLLGLSWIFGALINVGGSSSSLVFQYLFAITTTLQGFAVFIFHGLLNQQVREALLAMMRGEYSFSSGSTTGGRKAGVYTRKTPSSAPNNKHSNGGPGSGSATGGIGKESKQEEESGAAYGDIDGEHHSNFNGGNGMSLGNDSHAGIESVGEPNEADLHLVALGTGSSAGTTSDEGTPAKRVSANIIVASSPALSTIATTSMPMAPDSAATTSSALYTPMHSTTIDSANITISSSPMQPAVPPVLSPTMQLVHGRGGSRFFLDQEYMVVHIEGAPPRTDGTDDAVSDFVIFSQAEAPSPSGRRFVPSKGHLRASGSYDHMKFNVGSQPASSRALSEVPETNFEEPIEMS